MQQVNCPAVMQPGMIMKRSQRARIEKTRSAVAVHLIFETWSFSSRESGVPPPPPAIIGTGTGTIWTAGWGAAIWTPCGTAPPAPHMGQKAPLPLSAPQFGQKPMVSVWVQARGRAVCCGRRLRTRFGFSHSRFAL